MTDPGLRFWLDYATAGGGLCEPSGDSTLLMLPPELAERHGLPEELQVTDDPDVARSDGVTFMGTGHPALTEAAEAVIGHGDAGYVRLRRPPGPVPAAEVLQEHARGQIPVDHGRIDVSGAPTVAVHWLVRVGAMVGYAVSAEDHFTERVECWLHLATRRAVPEGVLSRLALLDVDSAPDGPAGRPVLDEVLRAVAVADDLIETEAARRESDLVRQSRGAHDAERERAETYYADVVAGIERRIHTAAPDRRALLEQRLTTTEQERARRLSEIAEKYRPQREVKPYRLHVIGVPAVRVPVDVRRGERRYPMQLDWLAGAGAFAQPACPACGRAAPLVAGKSGLGCLRCQPPKPAQLPPPPAASPPRPAAAPPAKAPAAKVPPAKVPPAKVPAAKVPAGAPSAKAPPVRAPEPERRQPAGKPRAAGRARAERVKPGQVAASARGGGCPPKRVDSMIKNFWTAAAAGRSLRGLLVAGSPAAALHAVYGPVAAKAALGIPGHEELVAFDGETHRTGDDTGITAGTLRTARGEARFALPWQCLPTGPAVAEILTIPLLGDGRFHLYYWWSADLGGIKVTGIPAPVHPPDEVALSLLTVGGAWHGIAVAARAMAAWQRLAPEHPDLLAGHRPAVLAAGVHRLVAARAGDRGLFRAAAEAYQVGEPPLRRADARLRKLLDLGPTRPW